MTQKLTNRLAFLPKASNPVNLCYVATTHRVYAVIDIKVRLRSRDVAP